MIMATKKIRRNKYVPDFPYSELLNISPLDIYTQEKCICSLIQFSKKHTFYENLKNLKIVMEFLTINLCSCDDENYTESIVFSQLFVIRKIVKNLNPDLLSHVTNVETLLNVICHLGPLNIFSKCSAKIGLEILLGILKPLEEVPEKAIPCLLVVRKKLLQLEALEELAQFCGFIFQRFPLKNCGMMNWSATWVIKNALDILSNDETHEEALTLKAVLMATTLDLWQVVAEPLSKQSLGSLTTVWRKFIEKLTGISARIVEYCGERTTRKTARALLGLILLNFMAKENILNKETSDILAHDLSKLPVRLTRWPSVKYLSFFWICHLLHTNDSCMWTLKEVSEAISDLVFSHDQSNLTTEILKSVCYIYPKALKTCSYPTKSTYVVGVNILTYIECYSNIPISKILSFDFDQLVWILSLGFKEITVNTIKWWLLKSNTGVLTEVKNLIKANGMEPLILDILVHNKEVHEESKILIERCIELVQDLHCPAIAKGVAYHLLSVSLDDDELFGKLMKTRPKVPEDQRLGVNLLTLTYYFLPKTEEDDAFRETCRFIRYLLKENMVLEAVNFVFNNDFLLKFLTSKIKNNRQCEKMVQEIIKLIIVLVQGQTKRNRFLDPTIIVDLTPLLYNTNDQNISLYLDLFCQIARSGSFSSLKPNENVLKLALFLMTLSGMPSCCTKSNISLMELLKAHNWLAEVSLFGQCLEHRCFFLGRSTSLSFLKLLIVWIKLVFCSERRGTAILPNRKVLEPYIIRCAPKNIKTYLWRLDVIYRDRRKITK